MYVKKCCTVVITGCLHSVVIQECLSET